MSELLFEFRFGPNDGERIPVPLPAPARIIIDDSGMPKDVSHLHHYPCYVRYLLERDGEEVRVYEYEGEPPVGA